MRAEELVRRADQHVHVPGGDVDRPVRPVVHRVRPGQRARAVRELDDPAHVRRGAHRVGRDRERHDPRPLGELPLEVRVVEREIVVDLDEADDDAEVVGELEPGRDVRVVVELRHEHLVARAQRPREGAREEEVEGGHARAERDLLVRAAEEVPRPPARVRDELVGAVGRLVRRADVGVRLAQVAGDRVDHLVRALRAARAVEEGERALECRIARADGGDVEQSCAHASSISLPLTVQR